MKKKKSIREEVVEILNEWVRVEKDGAVFTVEDTLKNSTAGRKISKSELRKNSRWSARSDSGLFVDCIGFTMSEFIKEYRNNNCIYSVSKIYNIKKITIQSKHPQWKSDGYVLNIDLANNEITLQIKELLFIDELKVNISKHTPKWLIKNPSDRFAVFTCKIYHDWKQKTSIDAFDSKEIWSSFELDRYLTKQEYDYYY